MSVPLGGWRSPLLLAAPWLLVAVAWGMMCSENGAPSPRWPVGLRGISDGACGAVSGTAVLGPSVWVLAVLFPTPRHPLFRGRPAAGIGRLLWYPGVLFVAALVAVGVVWPSLLALITVGCSTAAVMGGHCTLP